MAEEHKDKQIEKEKKDELKKIGKEKLTDKIKEKLSVSKKEEEDKVILEREYIIPLRRRMSTVPSFKRAKKAIRVMKEFLAKHMRVEDRDLRLVKVDMFLNNEIWFRGIKHPPSKIKVKARKLESGIVEVELAEIPEAVKWKMQKEEKKQEKSEKAMEKMPAKEHEEKESETKEEKAEEKEKEAAVIESGLKAQKLEAKQMKHTKTEKPKDKEQIHRQVLER